MPSVHPMSIPDAAEQERALLAEIARVSGLVNKEKLRKERIQSLRFDRNHPAAVVPPLPAIHKRQYSTRGRGTRRGRGRGGSFSVHVPQSRKYVREAIASGSDMPSSTHHRRRGAVSGTRVTRGRRGMRGRRVVRGKSRYGPGRQAGSKRASNKSKVRERKGYCMFFVKHGECKNKEHCRYTHDPSKVRVCPAFVRGKCENKKCLLQHKVDQEMMPVCFHFLNGTCSKENCPYSHVRVNHNASVCKDFVKGYCAKGSSCTELHSLDCQAYLKTGYCQQKELKKCPLRHSRKLRMSLGSKKRKQRLVDKEMEENRVKESVENDRSFLPSFARDAEDDPFPARDDSHSDSDDMATSDEDDDEEQMVWFESDEEEEEGEAEEELSAYEEDEGDYEEYQDSDDEMEDEQWEDEQERHGEDNLFEKEKSELV